MRSLVPALLFAPVFLFAWSTHAQGGGLSGAIGDYSAETGTKGAVTNRRIADQLYKQALEDERNAWKSFPPNVALLSRALANSKDAKALDDQAKEFARASLHGLQSGSQTGDLSGFQTERHGIVDPSVLNDLATNNSPYQDQVSKTLGGYGMNLDADRMVLKTPFGDVNVNVSRETMENVMRKAATALGYNPDEVSRGVADAERLRNQIASQVASSVEAEFAAKKAALAKLQAGKTGADAASAGAQVEGANGASEGSTAASNSESSERGLAALGEGEVGANAEGGSESDWELKARRLRESQNAMKRSMGFTVQAEGEPIGHAGDDLFQMVHRKYQAMRRTGTFIETVNVSAAKAVRATHPKKK